MLFFRNFPDNRAQLFDAFAGIGRSFDYRQILGAGELVFEQFTALGTLILLSVWQFGSPMLIFLAGLKQIPQSYYEAASIDGAGAWKQFLHITLPSLSPIIFYNFLMQTIGSFMSFTQSYIVTAGGPVDETLMYALYIYQTGFTNYHMGYASALSWISLIIIGIITAVIFKTSNYWVFYESKAE